MKHSNTFFHEPNNETPQIFRHLCWDLARAHNLDLGSTIYSVLLSCTSNTFSHCFPFFSSSPNFPCLTGWDDQNLNNQCWHYWVPSLGIMLNPLGGTEPWQLTSCRALSLVVCMFSTKGLTVCSVFEVLLHKFVARLKRTTVQVLQNTYYENIKPVSSHEQDTSRTCFERFLIFLFFFCLGS